MKATMQEDREKNGVHQANEHHNPRRPRKNCVHQADENHNPGRKREKRCSPSK
jgi:hypothetical protein